MASVTGDPDLLKAWAALTRSTAEGIISGRKQVLERLLTLNALWSDERYQGFLDEHHTLSAEIMRRAAGLADLADRVNRVAVALDAYLAEGSAPAGSAQQASASGGASQGTRLQQLPLLFREYVSR